FIFVGVWEVFSGNIGAGLWTAFIGWFLDNAASAQVHQVVFQGLLAGHKVSQANGHDAQIHPHHPIDDRDQENQPRPFCAEQLAYSRRMRIICGRMIAASKTTEITQTSNFADSSNM